MSYRIEQVEGISSHDAALLANAGITDSTHLLRQCATDEGRARVAAVTGLAAAQLATWFHQVDLMRVSGIGPEFGRLLESSGIESVRQLAVRDPGNVAHLMHRVNEMKRLTRAVPSMKTVAKWVSRARELEGLPIRSASAPVAVSPTPSLAASEAFTPAARPVPAVRPTPARYPTLTSTPVAVGSGGRVKHPGRPW